jgi:hypothetical protein
MYRTRIHHPRFVSGHRSRGSSAHMVLVDARFEGLQILRARQFEAWVSTRCGISGPKGDVDLLSAWGTDVEPDPFTRNVSALNITFLLSNSWKMVMFVKLPAGFGTHHAKVSF